MRKLTALLPVPKAEMLHGNRRRLKDVITRKERAHGNVPVIAEWKSGSRSEHGIEAPDFFDHTTPHRYAGPETANVPDVMHGSQHAFASEDMVWMKPAVGSCSPASTLQTATATFGCVAKLEANFTGHFGGTVQSSSVIATTEPLVSVKARVERVALTDGRDFHVPQARIGAEWL